MPGKLDAVKMAEVLRTGREKLAAEKFATAEWTARIP